ncbi:beta strand repeat-containing protein [Bartonella schoenbuchensis]|uniref:beta strand repeat-containing protein n=1 Tax=Bartonella schoenbuchensis TaxID=165694 RepID=UPI0031451032
MVMRRVFNHHVCLCVLSTAILAGLALMTSQTKVYAAQNCKGLAGSSEDESDKPIVCDGMGTGSGWKNRKDGWGELSGNRTIDMSKYSNEAAVTITKSTKIRIKSALTVTNNRGSNNNPAIKVDKGGVLVVDDADVAEVQKGIDVSGPSSSVTVVQGSIGVRKAGGGSLIEVKNSGKVVLMEGVTVGTISGSNVGEVVINNGGTVELNKVQLKDVTTGIVVKGGGNANVKGGATITVKQGVSGTGFKMEGAGTADVVDMTITGNGSGGKGAEVTNGTLTLNKVTLKQLETGAKVTGQGTLRMIGDSTITVGQNGKGLEVSGGTADVVSTMITLQGDGSKGLVMKGGIANVTLTRITGSGSGTTGVEVSGSADVTLTSVNVLNVQKGVEMRGGTLTVNGKSKIKVVRDGTGIDVSSGKVTMTEGEITAGGSGKGVVISGSANVTLTNVKMEQVATGIVMEGTGMLTMSGTTTINVEQGGMGLKVTGRDATVMMNGTLTITGKGNGTGMSVSNGTVTMEGKTTITVGVGGTGMSVTDGTVTMKGGLTIKGSGTTGVQMSGGTVMLEGGKISNFATGVEMTGGDLTLDGGMIVGNGSGVGINVTGGKGNVTVEGVEISKFATGINMEAGESLTVEGGRIEFAGGTGVKVGAGVTGATLTDVTITGSGAGGSKGVSVGGGTVMMERVRITLQGGGTGIYMEKGVKSASLTGVTITGVEAGIYMSGKGTFTVSGTTIQFTAEDDGYGYGVSVGSLVKSTELTNVTIKGSGGGSKGVWVKGGAVVMNTVGISGVTTGVEVTGKGMLTMTDGEIRFTEVGLKVEGETTATATVTGTKIVGSGNSGVGIHGVHITRGGHVVLKDCMFISNLPFISHTTSFYSLYLFMFSCMFFLQCVSVLFIFSCFE